MKRFAVLAVVGLLGLLSPLAVATPSHAKEPVRLGKLSCLFVSGGWQHPLGVRVDGPGRFRCSVEVSFTGSEPLKLPLTLTLDQPAEGDSTPPIHLQSKMDVQLASGTLELDVPAPDELNGCMPFTLTMQLGAQKKVKKSAADCGEG